jgi:hypothetical protein
MSAAVSLAPICLAVALARGRSGMTYEQLQALASRIFVDGDRQFVAQHPGRRYRVRTAGPTEVALHEILAAAQSGRRPASSIPVIVSYIAPAVTPRFLSSARRHLRRKPNASTPTLVRTNVLVASGSRSSDFAERIRRSYVCHNCHNTCRC